MPKLIFSPIFNHYFRILLFTLLSLSAGACSTLPETKPILDTASDPSEKAPETTTGHSQERVESNTAMVDDRLPSPMQEPLHIVAVGDVMLGTDFPKNHLPPDEGKYLLAGVASVLVNADVTFGNFEGSLLEGGEPAKKCRDPKRCYLFRTPPHYVQNLVMTGFDVMSLANNHARDFGESGRLASMAALSDAGIRHSGLQGDIARWQVNGYQLALVAFAPFRGAHDPLDIKSAAQLIREVKAENDLVLISMHLGAEGADATRIPFAEEFFHGENRGDVVAFSRAMIDAGASLVLGHGPHVPRAIELYQGHLIAYSLGNFCTYYGINVRGLNGLAPILSVTLSANGEFNSGQIISAEQIRPNGPTLDPHHRAAKLIAKLTAQDFPETPLEISADGQIKVKADKRKYLRSESNF